MTVGVTMTGKVDVTVITKLNVVCGTLIVTLGCIHRQGMYLCLLGVVYCSRLSCHAWYFV